MEEGRQVGEKRYLERSCERGQESKKGGKGGGERGRCSVFNLVFLSHRKHSIARRRYLRLATSGEERPTRFTYRNTASARDDSPPVIKMSGGCSNSEHYL